MKYFVCVMSRCIFFDEYDIFFVFIFVEYIFSGCFCCKEDEEK